MGESSKIEWTHHTFNPWWGCARVSPGCEHCYAETFAKRFGVQWGATSERRFFGAKHWLEPLKWAAKAQAANERRRVFCASMADVFEQREDLRPERDKLFALIRETPVLDWLLLTKRPENVMEIVPESWCDGFPRNVWLGVTAEDQKRADERIPLLLQCPAAAVRFVSYEPALGPVSFHRYTGRFCYCPQGSEPSPCDGWSDGTGCYSGSRPRLDWVIVGGESGPGARPFDVEWARSTIHQCRESGVACFVKQLGPCPRMRGDDLDGYSDEDLRWWTRNGGHMPLRDRKGGDPGEWPEDLRVREFPEVPHG